VVTSGLAAAFLPRKSGLAMALTDRPNIVIATKPQVGSAARMRRAMQAFNAGL
jgi:hypothetical protein